LKKPLSLGPWELQRVPPYVHCAIGRKMQPRHAGKPNRPEKTRSVFVHPKTIRQLGYDQLDDAIRNPI
jgi:hypothetical protein